MNQTDEKNLVRQIMLKDHRMHGEAFGFYADGTTRFAAHYHQGRLHGVLKEFDAQGKLKREVTYEHGRPTE